MLLYYIWTYQSYLLTIHAFSVCHVVIWCAVVFRSKYWPSCDLPLIGFNLSLFMYFYLSEKNSKPTRGQMDFYQPYFWNPSTYDILWWSEDYMEGFQKYGWPVQISKWSHFPLDLFPPGTLFYTSFSPKQTNSTRIKIYIEEKIILIFLYYKNINEIS